MPDQLQRSREPGPSSGDEPSVRYGPSLRDDAGLREDLSSPGPSSRGLSWAAKHGLSWTPAGLVNLLTGFGGYDVVHSIAYGSGPRRSLDVYGPDRAGRTGAAPVVVFFYGGSWQDGAKEIYRFVAAPLARRGHVVVVPDYRVYPDVRYPEFLFDAAAVVAWAREHALRFGGDPGRLILMGHSAGAYLAAMLAIDPQWLDAVDLVPSRDVAGLVGLAGPYDFLPLRDPVLKVIFGGANRTVTQPITHVRGDEPPALLVTGAKDRTVDPGNATRLAERLRNAGSAARVAVYPQVGHLGIIGAFSPPLRPLAPVLDHTIEFVRSLAPAAARVVVKA
jgi:acetyl esterase/lipase